MVAIIEPMENFRICLLKITKGKLPKYDLPKHKYIEINKYQSVIFNHDGNSNNMSTYLSATLA